MRLEAVWGGRRPPPRGGRRLSGVVYGMAAGAALALLLDPRRGAARRAGVRQRAGRAVRQARRFAEAGARDLEHRVRGLAHEVSSRWQGGEVPDEVLVERVRAALGRVTEHHRLIDVTSQDGEVELRGHVLDAEWEVLVHAVKGVRGVRDVVDHMKHHARPGNLSALQGATVRPGPSPELLQERWSPGTRLVAGAGGAYLLARGLFGRGLLRPLYGITGGVLLARVIEDEPLRPLGQRLARRMRGMAVEGADRAQHAAARAQELADRAAGKVSEAAGEVRRSASAEQAPGAAHPGEPAGGARRARGKARATGEKEKARKPGADVEEVQSPAELEGRPGSGSPAPAPAAPRTPGYRTWHAAPPEEGTRTAGPSGEPAPRRDPGGSEAPPKRRE